MSMLCLVNDCFICISLSCSELPETMENTLQQAVQATSYLRPVSIQLHSRCLILDFCMMIVAAKTVNIKNISHLNILLAYQEIVYVVHNSSQASNVVILSDTDSSLSYCELSYSEVKSVIV